MLLGWLWAVPPLPSMSGGCDRAPGAPWPQVQPPGFQPHHPLPPCLSSALLKSRGWHLLLGQLRGSLSTLWASSPNERPPGSPEGSARHGRALQGGTELPGTELLMALLFPSIPSGKRGAQGQGKSCPSTTGPDPAGAGTIREDVPWGWAGSTRPLRGGSGLCSVAPTSLVVATTALPGQAALEGWQQLLALWIRSSAGAEPGAGRQGQIRPC